MKHVILQTTGPVLANLEDIIRRKIQSREKQITINAMAILPESVAEVPSEYNGIYPYSGSRDNHLQNTRIFATIDQCQSSIQKLLVIGDTLNHNNFRTVQQLLSCDAFDDISIESLHTILELRKSTYSEKMFVGLMVANAARSSESSFSVEPHSLMI